MLLGSVDFKQKISSDHTNKQQGRKVNMFQQRNRIYFPSLRVGQTIIFRVPKIILSKTLLSTKQGRTFFFNFK